AARFGHPTGVAVDSLGTVYVAEQGNHTIRKVTSAGVVTTLAGTVGTPGSADGTGAAARFSNPFSIAIDAAGNLYVGDVGNSILRKVTSAGVVTTLAGTAGLVGSADGTGADARFSGLAGVAVDSAGKVYIADTNNHTLRKVTVAGAVTTLAGTAGTPGGLDGTGAEARFNVPDGVAVDSAGNVYVADTGNSTIRKITPAGIVTTLAGSPGVQGSADGTGAAARFSAPDGVAVDSAGNLYVAETSNHTIRKITPAGVVTTLAGAASMMGSLDGTGAEARFAAPDGVAVDSAGNLYVAERINSTVRKITPAGVVTTLAGAAGMLGSVDGTGAAARFNHLFSVAVDGAGNVYVCDRINVLIRKITPAGVVTTLAGAATMSGSADGTGADARFNFPLGVTADRAGNVYVADTNNSSIRKITPAGTTTTVAGMTGMSGTILGATPRFSGPRGVAIAGDSIVISAGNAIVLLRHGAQ
ncbi:MAG TPA: NHL repeat-containing protein, partial [Kofleriaceae bacterium]|nr:NHL repeat-containing protein [Kofleriaceae bacterium]